MKKIEKLLAKFLETKVKITPRNERADADIKDVKALEDLIRAICEAKWEESYDGFIPVQVELINRSTHEAFHYSPQPYIKDEEEKGRYQVNFEEKMRIATTNLSIATKEVDTIWRNQESTIRVEKAIAENRYCRWHGEQSKPNTPCPECSKRFSR